MKKTSLTVITLFTLAVLSLSACVGNKTSASLTGEWMLVSYGNTSNPTPALPNVETSVNFNEDGTFGGNVGCNSFGADYKVNDDKITFGSIMSTMMFCEETSSQESAVLAILTDKTVSFAISENELTLESTDSISILVLARK